VAAGSIRRGFHASVPLSALIRSLPPGPLDIIGDVHGEIDALEAVLQRIGQADSSRAARPHLVFLGDLVDRGPDSLAVVDRVAGLVRDGRATCILGNHELNLLRDRKRSGNQWFWGADAERWSHAGDGEVVEGIFHSRPATEADRERILAFFETLPAALSRPDLRVVHAAWHPSAIAALRDCADYTEALARSDADAASIPAELVARCKAEHAALEAAGIGLRNASTPPPALPALAEAAAIDQNHHHLSVVTSGPEEVRPGLPAWRAGRWRVIRRQRWWHGSVDTPTIFGHYWRLRLRSADASRLRLFDDSGPTDWLGPDRNAFCLDFSVGRRYQSRVGGSAPAMGFREALGALRWTGPDHPSELWFDDQDTPLVVPPPGCR
jgi:hypothetical protein